MPELPEVETMVRGVRDAVVGRQVTAVRRCRCRFKPLKVGPTFATLAKRTRGCRVEAVTRFAKRFVLELSGELRVAVEPRMTGLMLLADPPDRSHLRFEWRFADGGPSLWHWDRRGLGTMTLYDAAGWAALRRSLGPDALEMTPALWRERLAKTSRAVKVALLDPKVVAGIGNIYASESLHVAGIDPARPASGLSHNETDRLADAARDVLTTAIAHEGSTLADGTYRNALNREGKYQNSHRVYARAGETCPTCRRGEVVRLVQAQRSTFFCPACQA